MNLIEVIKLLKAAKELIQHGELERNDLLSINHQLEDLTEITYKQLKKIEDKDYE